MLTENMRRVFALNCVLNGHSLLSAYDHSLERAAEGLGISTEEVRAMDFSLRKLEEDKKDAWCASQVTRVILNLFRTREYSFIYVQDGPIYLQELAESDRQGQIREDVREGMLSCLIQDIQYIKDGEQPHYFDGLLLIPHSVTNSDLKRCIMDAYKLYRDGPGTGKEPVLKWRFQMSVVACPTLQAGQLVTLLKRLLKDGHAPSSYTKSTLMIPDWLVTYEATGCICEHSLSEPGRVNISMADPDNREKTVCISASTEELATIVRGGLRKLGLAACEKIVSGKRSIYRLSYGGSVLGAEV